MTSESAMVACSFCGKRKDQVAKLIFGPSKAAICDGCVRLCNEIMTEDGIPIADDKHRRR